MYTKSLLLKSAVAAFGLMFTTGCEGENPQAQDYSDGSHTQLTEYRSASIDDMISRTSLSELGKPQIGIEATARVDGARFPHNLHEHRATMQLKPIERDDIFETSAENLTLSSIGYAEERIQVLPCQLEYLAIDDIYSGNPIDVQWIANSTIDYEIYVDVYPANGSEPLATLTQFGTDLSQLDLYGQLEPHVDYEVVVEVINHTAHEVCLSDGTLTFAPQGG
jgi:hypothetical protein